MLSKYLAKKQHTLLTYLIEKTKLRVAEDQTLDIVLKNP